MIFVSVISKSCNFSSCSIPCCLQRQTAFMKKKMHTVSTSLKTFAIRCIHLFINQKEEEKKKSSPHPHRTAIPICSSVPLVRMPSKGTSTGRCKTCFYFKFCDLLFFGIIVVRNLQSSMKFEIARYFFFRICQTEITFQLINKKTNINRL